MKTIKTLTELGLSLNQARIYVAILRSEQPITAKGISKITKITRQDVYRIMPSLQKDGLIEKTITSPTMFKGTPIEIGVSILIKNKIAKENELIEKAKKLVTVETYKKQLMPDEENQFVLIPGNDAVIQKINKATENVQTSLDIVTSRMRFPRGLIEFFDARIQALQSGASIRVVTERLASTNTHIEELMAIERKAGARVRFLPTPAPALFLLFDKKQVMLITSATGTLETSALWSNNPCLVELSKNYFEMVWNTATDIPIK
jgi:sugar-specific transcriptional regulator TrmB